MSKRITVIWLCNFANKEINELFGTDVKELSPWISGLIGLFKNDNSINLHILAPNLFTNKTVVFEREGITYNFFQYRSRIISRSIYNRFRLDFRTNFFGIKRRVKSIIKDINPDIVHLIGAENPYYSAAIIPIFDLYPVLVSIQGFVRHASGNSYVHNRRVEIEEIILKKALYIGIQAEFMENVIKSINPFARIFRHNYPNTLPGVMKTNQVIEKYDFVFFARVVKDKGIEDLLQAIRALKRNKDDISLLIIGKILKPYEILLKEMIQELDIEKNVYFTGFLPTQQDVFQAAIKAKICVLPTYHDIIPGTLIESIFMKLPAIAYNVGGVPDLNLRKESVILVGKKNITELQEKMWWLLNNNKRREELAETAYNTIKEQYNNNTIHSEFTMMYENILNLKLPTSIS